MNMKKIIVMVSVVVLSSTAAFAKLSKANFVRKCASLVTDNGRVGPDFSCAAKTDADAKKLKSIGVKPQFSITIDESAEVGTSYSGSNKLFADVAVTVKSGLFGIGSKSLRLACQETPAGGVEVYSPQILVDIQDNIDSKVTAEVTCR
ncbi:MAG TPA: hypothetical protein VIG33_06190 [Pseudobdellovibrionaceae bacterium]